MKLYFLVRHNLHLFKKLNSRKSNWGFKRAFLQKTLLSIAAIFPEELLFYNILFQKSYYFTATFPFPSYTSYLSVRNKVSSIPLVTVKVWEFLLAYLLLLKAALLSKFIWLVGYTKHCGTATIWVNCLLSKLLFQSVFFLRTSNFSKELFFFARYTFSENAGGILDGAQSSAPSKKSFH